MRRYLVELHDMRRGSMATADALLALAPEEARALACWLVVPRWYHQAPIGTGDALVARIPGDALVLHGLTHLAGPSAWNRAWYGVDDEGEFRVLARDDAAQRMTAGCAELQRAFGVSPRWFCAPRWQLGAPAAAQACGLGLMTRDALVRPDGTVRPAPALWFDYGERRLARLAGNAHHHVRARHVLGHADLVRVTLHPRDLQFPATRQAIASTFRQLQDEGWQPCTLVEAAGSASDA